MHEKPSGRPRAGDHPVPVAGRRRVRIRLLGRRTGLFAPLLGIGLLLWARLILVSDMPRMALAEPEEPASATPADDGRSAEPADASAPASPAGADAARSGESFPDPHDPHTFTPEGPKSARDPSE